jgi:diguanylate cyclase (GGDEF)-like protein
LFQSEDFLLRPDGNVLPVIRSVVEIELSGRKHLIESFVDISERKEMEEKLKHLSLHDPLTNLFNRTHFEQELQRLSVELRGPVGIVVCDLDGLKLVNDTLGHEAGDQLLVAAARVIQECFGKEDLVARVGGDEFAVILTPTSKETVQAACRRLREMVADYNSRTPELPLSLSIGFAVEGERLGNLGDLYKEADNQMYREKLHQNRSARSAIVQALMKALEARDFITEGHAERIQKLMVCLGQACGFSEHQLHDLRLFAQFHDIGKVGISDQILLKPGPLTEDEIARMRSHCEIGYRMARSLTELEPVANWILKHHEWWNGQGYPLGLKGEGIPLECRMLAIADAYDAMTSDRPYRKAVSPQEAVHELRRCAGSQFDPVLVEKFVELCLDLPLLS